MLAFAADCPAPADAAALAVATLRLGDAIAALPPEAQAGWDGLHDPLCPALAAIFGGSPYLTELALRRAAMLPGLLRCPDKAALGLQMDALLEDIHDRPEDGYEAAMQRLRLAKQQAALLIALADLAGWWPVEAVTSALTRLADRSVAAAADRALRVQAARGRLALPDAMHPAEGSGLVVLAMGKQGSGELNYSSDIDLIVLYDSQAPALPEGQEPAPVFIAVARDIVRLIEERTRDGYVFRTDLRLRPDPSATPLAVSLAAAEGYYGSQGQNWERAAMIKARPVAGDPIACRSFQRFLEPFVWRRSLDFHTLQDIHSIKRQIARHHGHGAIAVAGHDVKLGRGGIRDIEFFVQVQQLIFGGRLPQLRVPPTVPALAALAAAELVTADTATALTAAYRFLRHVEHRLQMIDDRQTQTLPTEPGALQRLAVFAGFDGTDSFAAALTAHMQAVERAYAGLFEAAPDLGGAEGSLVFTGVADDAATLEQLRHMGFHEPARAAAMIRDWHRGHPRALRTERARQLLTELLPALLAQAGATEDADATLLRLDSFLRALPAGVQILSLLLARPHLLALIVDIMGSAPALGAALELTPQRLDAVLTGDFLTPLDEPDLPTPAQAAEVRAGLGRRLADTEEVLTFTLRWAGDRRFRAGVHILRSLTAADATGPFLTRTAEVALALVLAAVEAEMTRVHGRVPGGSLAFIAYGRFGQRQLGPRSDWDLVAVFDAPEDAVSDGAKPLDAAGWYRRLTQRLLGHLGAQMREGRLAEVDMRLRPHGNKGALATSRQAWRDYQYRDAWTWEHMALTAARPLRLDPAAADAPLAATLERDIAALLAAEREAPRALADAAAMRRRMAAALPPRHALDVKRMAGGIADIDFIAQALVLQHGQRLEGQRPPMRDAESWLAALAEIGALERTEAAQLGTLQRLWRRIQGLLRQTGKEELMAGAPLPPALLAPLRTAMAASVDDDLPVLPEGADFAAVSATVAGLAATARALYDRLVEEPAAATGLSAAAPRPALGRVPPPLHPAEDPAP